MLNKKIFLVGAVAVTAMLMTQACGLRGSLYLPEDREQKNKTVQVNEVQSENTVAEKDAEGSGNKSENSD
ncbi:MAG: lipoprotein [Ruminobacter sp.]|jgi:predicted small lipoprotein YifL|uniref:Lipoprotein-attachment site-containing protein n=1 Tax=Ruminobacter amylophilus TaxID=867 RepID=A0A662ZL67_9GAMM|nr:MULTISPECIES: lipoprotein [Ruminobacter]MBQ3775569.1 lipoprotein [Ruminobacter sp.]SFP47792.1 hypothetical protein SAMN02910344_01493 [Ruminobacter amylophilus]